MSECPQCHGENTGDVGYIEPYDGSDFGLEIWACFDCDIEWEQSL